jgi:hypothetical protein
MSVRDLRFLDVVNNLRQAILKNRLLSLSLIVTFLEILGRDSQKAHCNRYQQERCFDEEAVLEAGEVLETKGDSVPRDDTKWHSKVVEA